ncbi:hypothetical protein GJAV_G00188780 [Gymnothorax javanicus]|nr:hypothetical protein GJAV_G00188780 [Gymnothorax javanicus]
MGNSVACVPQNNFGKSFIRKSSRWKVWKKETDEGPEKSNSIINIMSTVTKEMSPKDIETIQNIKWDPPPCAYDPSGGWKKSSINVKNYGRLVHSSRVRFRFLHCQEIHDCYLDLFQTHLHFVSNNTTGLTYQGTLPLKELTVCELQNGSGSNETNPFAFQINGIDSRKYMRTKSAQDKISGREELRNSVKNEPIYEWEGSQRESLGPIVYVTKVQLQHVPCQEQYDRLLVLYPAALIILSEEQNGLFYKGKLPLNMITVTTPCQDVRPNTFMIEGKLINPIIVSCLDKKEFHDWIHHFKASYIPVHIPPPPVYDIIDNPTKRVGTSQFDRWSGSSGKALAEAHRHSQNGRGSFEPKFHNHLDNPISPGYMEPLCHLPSRPAPTDHQMTARHVPRSNSFSHRVRPTPDFRAAFQRYSYAVNVPEVPASPIYNTPYPAVQAERYFLVKSNSWSTPQSGGRYHLSGPQRYSDMCAPRRPLSPLYDDPTTPGRYLLEDNYVRQAVSAHNPNAQLLPPNFKLCTPPLGRRRKNLQDTKQQEEEQNPDWTAEQRAQAVSRLKLLSPPTTLTHGAAPPMIYPSQSYQMPYNYVRDDNAFLEAAEPDDQEMDYDNVWDFDKNGQMIQPMPVLSPQWTTAGLGVNEVRSPSSQPRW